MIIIGEIREIIQDITNSEDTFVVYLGKKYGKEVISVKNDNGEEEQFFLYQKQ